MVRRLVGCLGNTVIGRKFGEFAENVSQDELCALRRLRHAGLFSVAFCLLVFYLAEAPGIFYGGVSCLLSLSGKCLLPLAVGLLTLGTFFLGSVVQYAFEFSSLGCLLECL